MPALILICHAGVCEAAMTWAIVISRHSDLREMIQPADPVTAGLSPRCLPERGLLVFSGSTPLARQPWPAIIPRLVPEAAMTGGL